MSAGQVLAFSLGSSLECTAPKPFCLARLQLSTLMAFESSFKDSFPLTRRFRRAPMRQYIQVLVQLVLAKTLVAQFYTKHTIAVQPLKQMLSALRKDCIV